MHRLTRLNRFEFSCCCTRPSTFRIWSSFAASRLALSKQITIRSTASSTVPYSKTSTIARSSGRRTCSTGKSFPCLTACLPASSTACCLMLDLPFSPVATPSGSHSTEEQTGGLCSNANQRRRYQEPRRVLRILGSGCMPSSEGEPEGTLWQGCKPKVANYTISNIGKRAK